MLSCQRAATEAAMEYGLDRGGVGWSKVPELRGDVFQRMSVVSDSQFSSIGYGGHGGRDETAAMMYLCPGTVDLKALKKERPAWAADAHEATVELGGRIAKAIVAGWVNTLKRERTPRRRKPGMLTR